MSAAMILKLFLHSFGILTCFQLFLLTSWCVILLKVKHSSGAGWLHLWFSSVFQHAKCRWVSAGVVVQNINKEGNNKNQVEENKGEENLLRDTNQVIHSVILKRAPMRKERRKKNREPFALLCKCNIASEKVFLAAGSVRLRRKGSEGRWLENQLMLARAAAATGGRSWPAGGESPPPGLHCSQATWPAGLHCSQVRQEQGKSDQSTIGSSPTNLQKLSVRSF